MSDALREQLRKSPAVTSLRTEQRVADRLRSLGWNAVHGFFYQDEESNKYREVDVAATMDRTFCVDGFVDETRLTIVVECKTGTESNLIITPHTNPGVIPADLDLTPTISTAGAVVERAMVDLRGVIGERFVGPDPIDAYNTLLRRYYSYMDNGDMAEGVGLWTPPPSASWVTTAYRETSGIKEKDVDNSVLWRAFQGVYSAISALQLQSLSYASTWAIQAFESGFLEDRNLLNAIARGFSSAAGQSTVYHPVVVTHANLWVLTENDLEAVPQFRFLQVNSLGLPSRWVDVVHVDAFEDFSSMVTEYYKGRLDRDTETNRVTRSGALYHYLTEGG